MKARITQPPEKAVLCYNLTPQHMQAVAMCAEQLSAKTITADDPFKSVSELLAAGRTSPAEEKNDSPAPQEECLLFSGFDRKSLNILLESLKSSGVRIPLKAVLTPHNSGWILADLIAELKREHKQMTGGGGR